MKLQTTSGTHKKYKPGRLVTIYKNVFRITKNESIFFRLLQQVRFISI